MLKGTVTLNLEAYYVSAQNNFQQLAIFRIFWLFIWAKLQLQDYIYHSPVQTP